MNSLKSSHYIMANFFDQTSTGGKITAEVNYLQPEPHLFFKYLWLLVPHPIQ